MQYVYGLFKSVLQTLQSPFSVEHIKLDNGNLPILNLFFFYDYIDMVKDKWQKNVNKIK